MISMLRNIIFLIFTIQFVSLQLNGQFVNDQFEIPVLCYHQIVKGNANTSSITVNVLNFEAQMKLLHDKGYRTILPGDLYAYLLHQRNFSFKAFLITFDDGSEGQFSNALPVLNKYGFKATFFIMTVALNKKGYMSASQILELQRQGHVIGNHTWDHHNVTNYTSGDWKIQIGKTSQTLQKITGRTPEFFAYPYGAWNKEAINHLKAGNYKLAFILHTPVDKTDRFYTVRRLMVYNGWKPDYLMNKMKSTFHLYSLY